MNLQLVVKERTFKEHIHDLWSHKSQGIYNTYTKITAKYYQKYIKWICNMFSLLWYKIMKYAFRNFYIGGKGLQVSQSIQDHPITV